MLHFHVYLKYVYCSCVHRGLKACLHILPPILGFLWHDPFSGFSFFKACSFSGLGLCLAMGFSSFNPVSCPFLQSLCVLPYCSTILLWRYLTHAYWASLDSLLILPLMTQYSHLGIFGYIWASLTHLFSLGPFGPFS